MNNKKDNNEENNLYHSPNFFGISYNDSKNNKTNNSKYLAFSSRSGPPDDKPIGPPDDKPIGPPDDKPIGPPDDKPIGPPDDKPIGPPDDKPIGPPDDKPIGPPDDKPIGPPTKYTNDIKHKINNEISAIAKKINKYRVGHINKKIIYSAIGIIAVAVIIMIFSQESDFKISPPKFNQGAVTEAKALEISLKNVSVTNIDNNIKINTIFDVYNPNEGTLILENINYNVNLDKIRIASGDIGQRPEGFVDSQAGIYPIIGNGTMTLKDEKTIQKDDRIYNVWNKIADKSSSFQVNGSFAYKQTSSFQAHGGEIDFNLVYP
jgi:hypothetical protein